MIHFDCPNCGERMDIDSGFRGAVARCEKCGALIQVPTKTKAQPKRIVRPRKPTAPTPVAKPGAAAADEHPRRSARPYVLAFVVVAVLIGLGAAYAWWRVKGGAP